MICKPKYPGIWARDRKSQGFRARCEQENVVLREFLASAQLEDGFVR